MKNHTFIAKSEAGSENSWGAWWWVIILEVFSTHCTAGNLFCSPSLPLSLSPSPLPQEHHFKTQHQLIQSALPHTHLVGLGATRQLSVYHLLCIAHSCWHARQCHQVEFRWKLLQAQLSAMHTIHAVLYNQTHLVDLGATRQLSVSCLLCIAYSYWHARQCH